MSLLFSVSRRLRVEENSALVERLPQNPRDTRLPPSTILF